MRHAVALSLSHSSSNISQQKQQKQQQKPKPKIKTRGKTQRHNHTGHNGVKGFPVCDLRFVFVISVSTCTLVISDGT